MVSCKKEVEEKVEEKVKEKAKEKFFEKIFRKILGENLWLAGGPDFENFRKNFEIFFQKNFFGKNCHQWP